MSKPEIINPAPSGDDLTKVLNESAVNINNEMSEKLNKKRGPKGPRKPKDGNNSVVASPQLIKYSKDQYKQSLAGVFMISGMYLSKVTKFDGFMLAQDEVEALSSQGAEVCDAFLPAIDSKWIALGGFTLATFAVYGAKMMAYDEFRNKQLAESKKATVKKEN